MGPGGHFLAQKTTRAAARGDEFLVPTLVPRLSYESWVELGRPSMYAAARERVREILAGPVADPVPETTVAEVGRILAEADRELRGRVNPGRTGTKYGPRAAGGRPGQGRIR